MLLHLVISASTFVALVLGARWVLYGSRRPVEARIRALAIRQSGPQLVSVPFQMRVVVPVVDSIGAWVVSILPGRLVRRIERRLVLAGQPMKPSTLWALALGLGALLAGSYISLILAATGGTAPPVAFLPAALLGLMGALLPILRLSSQARARKVRLLRGLPDSLDLLTISLEAGLSLDAAFHQIAEKQGGPFVDELRRMLQEIGLGKTRRDALLDLAERTQLDDIQTLVGAIIQAEQMGTSLAPILRAQAQRLRVRRRQRAEQEARRAPVKMVFPLVFCLMPSLFIFILGPLVVSVVDFLAGQ